MPEPDQVFLSPSVPCRIRYMAGLAADFRAFSVRGPVGQALRPKRSFNPLSSKGKSSQFCIVINLPCYLIS